MYFFPSFRLSFLLPSSLLSSLLPYFSLLKVNIVDVTALGKKQSIPPKHLQFVHEAKEAHKIPSGRLKRRWSTRALKRDHESQVEFSKDDEAPATQGDVSGGGEGGEGGGEAGGEGGTTAGKSEGGTEGSEGSSQKSISKKKKRKNTWVSLPTSYSLFFSAHPSPPSPLLLSLPHPSPQPNDGIGNIHPRR